MSAHDVTYSTPKGVMSPIGPYSHISKAGNFISIGAIAGVDPTTGLIAGDNVAAQTTQIINSLKHMLRSVGSDIDHILHVNVFLKDMNDFEDMNKAYTKALEGRIPPRTTLAVVDLPKHGALLTMNATAVLIE